MDRLKDKVSNKLSEEITKAYKQGHHIADLVVSNPYKNDMCIFIEEHPKIEIGEGGSGIAYKINIEGKFYIIKEIQSESFTYRGNFFGTEETLYHLTQYVGKKLNIDPDLLLYINGGDKNEKTDILIVPSYMINCVVESDRVENGLKLNKGDYFCDEMYTEYLIGLLAAKIRRDGKSPHFIDVFDMIICPSLGDKSSKIYTFMEYIDILDDDDTKSCVIPTSTNIAIFHSLYLLQKQKINHNDLHTGNIFVERIKNDTIYNGVKLVDYDYFEYRYNGKSVYIPRPDCMIRIGDFGYSCKYDNPKILSNAVINKEFDTVPNVYNTCYDLILYLFASSMTPYKFNNMFKFALGKYIDLSKGVLEEFHYEHPDGRLTDKDIDDDLKFKIFKTPEEMLDYHGFDELRKKPNGKILLIATDE